MILFNDKDGKSKKHIGYVFILFILLLILALFIFISCQSELEQFKHLLSTSEFSVTMVPHADLDLYFYAKQKNLTTIPANIINMEHDIQVESLAIWGVSGESDIAFGAGLTFDNEVTASEIYDLIGKETDFWKLLRGNNLYVVRGEGTGAKSLKKAIMNNDFKKFDNAKLIEASSMLPKSIKAKLIAIAMAEPSDQLVNFIRENVTPNIVKQIDDVLKMANLDLVIASLYSPHQINIARATEIIRGEGNLKELDLGLMIAVKSKLPGFLVEPNVKKMLLHQGLVEVDTQDFKVYKGYWSNPYTSAIPVIVRISDNYVFIAVSGQEEYAELLIRSIYK